MTFNTHRYLGILLYPAICETWSIPINKKRFLYGCVKPDITSLFFTHPHFFRISRKYVMKKIARLSGKKPSMEKKNKKFSEELGVILHYMADFFTSVHNSTPNRLNEHIAFETELCAAFETMVTADTVRAYFLFMKNRFRTGGDVSHEIARLHKANRCDIRSTEYDIREILTACVTAITGIMNAVTASVSVSVTEEETNPVKVNVC